MSFIIIIFSLFHVSTFSNVAVSYFTRWLVYTRDGTGQDFFDPTSKFQNHRRLTGREIFFSTMVLQIYYVTSCVPTLSFVLRSQFWLDPLYLQATWYDGTRQVRLDLSLW